jgi:hypothetical protein
VGSYLKIVEKANPKKKAEEVRIARPAPPNRSPTTKPTETTKDPSNSFTPLTVSEVLAEINRRGSGAGKNAELYRRGELTQEKAIEYVTCTLLHRRGESFEVWNHHAPAVRKALSLCIHELEPEKCNVCNAPVRRIIEEGGTV